MERRSRKGGSVQWRNKERVEKNEGQNDGMWRRRWRVRRQEEVRWRSGEAGEGMKWLKG